MAVGTGPFAGLNKSWKWIIILLSCLPFALLMEIQVSGPDTGLEGDFEQFTCVLEGDDVTPNTGLEWKYKLKNGEITSVSNSDMLTPVEVRSNDSGKVMVSSLIRLSSVDVGEIMCQHSPTSFGSKGVVIKDIKSVAINDDPCKKAADKPLTIMQTSTMDFTPPYRMARYLDGETVSVIYPTEVSQVQLTCISSKGGDSPIWSLKKEEAAKMKFAVWAQSEMENPYCMKQIINIFEVKGEPGETVKFSLQCYAGSSFAAPVNIEFKNFPTFRQVDFNRTENCVNEVVEQFYNKELTGVGVGSSFVIILLMVGMAVMKKQLNNQQNVNKDLQGQGNQSQGGGSNGGNNGDNGNPGVANPGFTMTA